MKIYSIYSLSHGKLTDGRYHGRHNWLTGARLFSAGG